MLKKIAIALCFMLTTGCALKQGSVQTMPVPEPGTREALLPTFEPTGSPCLDAVLVNMLYVGCSNIVAGRTEDGLTTFVGCTASQPGATDPYSTYTFIYSTEMTGLPPDGIPICADTTGMYSMIPVPIQALVRDE